MILFTVLTIVALVALSAFFSATETAITASSPGRIQKLKSEGIKSASLALVIMKAKEKVISSLLIGNSIVNIVCTTIATSLCIQLFGDDKGTIIASVIMSFVIIVFAEVTPKAIAVAKAERISVITARTIQMLLRILKPINIMLDGVVKALCFILRINLTQDVSGVDEVRGIIEHHHQEGNVYKSDRDMLGGVLDIRRMVVSEIMIHRSNISAINIDLPKHEIVEQALSSIHTRIPLWKDSKDNIVGVLHIKDLLRNLNENNNESSKLDIKALMSEPWFVPDNAPVIQQLQSFRERKTHFAFVVDEYGDLQGILTLEDILEEIVGQIDDEHDSTTSPIMTKSDTEYVIDGAITIRDLNRELNWDLPDNDANTLAGLIIHELERIPNQGETIKMFDLRITIMKKVSNRIKTIKVVVLPTTPDNEASD